MTDLTYDALCNTFETQIIITTDSQDIPDKHNYYRVEFQGITFYQTSSFFPQMVNEIGTNEFPIASVG